MSDKRIERKREILLLGLSIVGSKIVFRFTGELMVTRS